LEPEDTAIRSESKRVPQRQRIKLYVIGLAYQGQSPECRERGNLRRSFTPRLQKPAIGVNFCDASVKQRQNIIFGINGVMLRQNRVQWRGDKMLKNVAG
jgi:UDP-N-acetyl-D-mannosaminuronate dehydrogenase